MNEFVEAMTMYLPSGIMVELGLDTISHNHMVTGVADLAGVGTTTGRSTVNYLHILGSAVYNPIRYD
jgi:hypothetical protein